MIFSGYSTVDPDDASRARFSVRDIVEGMGYDVGLMDYPIFKESYRDELNSGILAHFWYRYPAADTPARFIFYLNRKLKEIMPSFNAVYKMIDSVDFDLLNAGGITTKSKGTQNQTSENESVGENSGDTIVSDTPQQLLNDMNDLKYANQLSRATGKQTGTTKSSGATDSDAESTTLYSVDTTDRVQQLLQQQYLNVDVAVYNALEVLFIQTWGDQND